MCETYVVRADEPFPLERLWPFTERLERYGIASFGWGAAWVGPAGAIETYRDVRAFREDATGRERVGGVITTAALVHLRRPSRLSTIGLADTQPFLDRAGRFAFSHNGDFRRHRAWRDRYRAAGRIHGRADSEVGLRWLEDEWGRGEPPLVLGALHDELGGQANVMVLAADGTPYAYAGNEENPIFRFRLDGLDLASTGIYSIDRSLFRYVAPAATERSRVRTRSVVAL